MVDDTVVSHGGDDLDEIEYIEVLYDDLTAVYVQLLDINCEIDDPLAESRFDYVKESLEQVERLISGRNVASLNELAELSTAAAAGSASSGPVVVPTVPRLAAEDFPQIPKLDSDEDDDEYIWTLRERTTLCADHIRRLIDDMAEVWSAAVEAARGGDTQTTRHSLTCLGQIKTELKSAYSLWEACLVDLYNENPSNLGTIGEITVAFQVWLAAQRK